MLSDSITAYFVSITVDEDLPYLLSHRSDSSTYTSNHYRDHFHSISWLSLSNLKGELLILLSFLLILFQDNFFIWASYIYQMYYLSLLVLDCDIRPSSS